MKHIPDIRALLRHMNKASEFIRWLRAEGDRLVASADLLGGRKWAARARSVVEAAKTGNDLAARRGEILALCRLLHLELTNYISSVEARRFAAVHPDDPPACDARHCAEALGRGLRALEAVYDHWL
ncbi:hypothetical protein FIU86_14245 [Roseovarius sp. THAF9]|uniref:hypothetical protein n=1 Tax=Roseovarius sp. THAF9 TaxID=2587847 RepID=UPI0012690395|nr:hypothetical protein [Roseovarius sp. THAF9]QFT94006.1 hypothetical protein FIU86_14245 [Roseovarius sp. THAF9]